MAGEVGNKIPAAELRIIDGPGDAMPPGCSSWDDANKILNCAGNVTLDKLDIRGSVDIDPAGTVSVTNTTITRTRWRGYRPCSPGPVARPAARCW